MIKLLVCYLFGCLVQAQGTKFKRANLAGVEKAGGRISVNNEVNMVVKVDAGWYSFAYGKQNQVAFRSFGVYYPSVVLLTVNSCFCPGNFFSVYDNGQPIMMTNITLPIVSVPFPPEPLNCTNPVSDPNICALDPTIFSQGSVLLLPGKHNITIVANQSPWGGGTAFLRADSACPQAIGEPAPCCLETGTCSKVIVA